MPNHKSPMQKFKLKDFQVMFPDDAACLDYLRRVHGVRQGTTQGQTRSPKRWQRSRSYDLAHCQREHQKRNASFAAELHIHNTLPAVRYQHKSVPHAETIYVLGDAHTNTIEGSWSQSKNCIRGVYNAVSGKYLQHYLDKFSFRDNHRNDVTPVFLSFLARVKPSAPGA